MSDGWILVSWLVEPVWLALYLLTWLDHGAALAELTIS